MQMCGDRRVDKLLWRLSNPVSNHYIYLMERKFNGFVVNKAVEDIIRKSIIKARDILSTHTIPPTHLGGSWKVKSLYTKFFYEVDRPYSKFACYLCPWGLRGNFYKHQCAIILQNTDIFENVLV